MSKVVIVPFENKHAEQMLDIGLNSKLLELKPEHRKYTYFYHNDLHALQHNLNY